MSKIFNFIVNGKKVEIGTQSSGFLLTYEKLVKIALGVNDSKLYTVTYATLDGRNGTITQDDSIEAESDMVFNVAYTGSA